MTTPPQFTCPCCGALSFTGPPGSFALCNVCDWEDDPIQLLDPAYRGGANLESLIQAQARFASRPNATVTTKQRHDPTWRPATDEDAARALTPHDLADTEVTRRDRWYYWLRSPNGP